MSNARRGLDTITEKQDEDIILQTNGATGKFEIESSHSFSLRNFNPRGSVMNFDSIQAQQNPGESSALSNYSKIMNETIKKTKSNQQQLPRNHSSKIFADRKRPGFFKD